MNKILVLFAILITTLVTGCTTFVPPEKEGKVTIQALVDGRDLIYIRGDKICIQHMLNQFIGEYNDSKIPVSINGTDLWYPKWNEAISDEHKFKEGIPALPTSGTWDESNMSIKFVTTGLGNIEIVTYPNENNNYTLTIKADDHLPSGAHWYFFDIDWE